MELTKPLKSVVYFLLLLFVLGDLGYSFIQHRSQPLDGDMAGGIVPADDVKPVLSDPFGTKALSGQTYSNPNKFFSHWALKEYFTVVPIALQRFTEPVESIYLSGALAKTAIQAVLIFLLAFAISGMGKVFKLDFIAAAALVTPLFQTEGYRGYMAIIDPCTTYVFFYSLPVALLLLYFLPFFNQQHHQKKPPFPLLIRILWIPLALVICLSGPLNPGIVLIVTLMLVFHQIRNHYSETIQPGFSFSRIGSILRFPKSYWFYLLPISLMSVYSLYIGTFNSINNETPIPLIDLYLKLPAGIYYQFTQKLGFPVLFIILIINWVWIHKKFRTVGGDKILMIYKWVGVFALIYILLLPLGGYRVYRPHILRYDTIIPLTISLMFLFGASTLFLLKNISSKGMIRYLPGIVAIILLFTFADHADLEANHCEKMALKEIAESTDNIVRLKSDCTVLSWWKLQKPEDSELNAQLLYQWRITKEKKLYCNQ